MYKELLARLKDQRESLDQSIVMLEEHIRNTEKSIFNPTAQEIWDTPIDVPVDTGHIEVIKGDSHDMELVKGLAPGMGEPISITGDPIQHKFKHVAKGILKPHVTQEGGIIFPNPTKDPLAHLYADGGQPYKEQEIEAPHSISKPMDIDHLRYSNLPAKAPQIYEHEDEVYVMFHVVKDKEFIQTHVYNSGSHNSDGAKEFAARQLQILESWVKEELGEELEIKTVYSCPLTKEDFDRQPDIYKEVYIYE